MSKTFEEMYPRITGWIKDGWIEIGQNGYSRSFIRALDEGGLVWEGDSNYLSMDAAFQAIENGLAEWQGEE